MRSDRAGASSSERAEASDPRTSPERLEELAESCPREVAQNPNASAQLLRDLAGKGHGEDVLLNPALPLLAAENPEAFEKLLHHIQSFVSREALASGVEKLSRKKAILFGAEALRLYLKYLPEAWRKLSEDAIRAVVTTVLKGGQKNLDKVRELGRKISIRAERTTDPELINELTIFLDVTNLTDATIAAFRGDRYGCLEYISGLADDLAGIGAIIEDPGDEDKQLALSVRECLQLVSLMRQIAAGNDVTGAGEPLPPGFVDDLRRQIQEEPELLLLNPAWGDFLEREPERARKAYAMAQVALCRKETGLGIRRLALGQGALFAAEIARNVLRLYEMTRPGDERPREAVEAAEAWGVGPTLEGATRAAEAAEEATQAAREVVLLPAVEAALACASAAAVAASVSGAIQATLDHTLAAALAVYDSGPPGERMRAYSSREVLEAAVLLDSRGTLDRHTPGDLSIPELVADQVESEPDVLPGAFPVQPEPLPAQGRPGGLLLGLFGAGLGAVLVYARRKKRGSR